MLRFMTYLKERSPLPAISFLALGICISSMAIKEEISWIYLIIGLVINNLLFIQMRLGDELKDYETDKLINPTRPLPRGLFTPAEVLTLLKVFLGVMIFTADVLMVTSSLLGGVSLFIAAIFSWLMFKEFYISHKLDKSPMLYAITHQIIVFPLFAWIGLCFNKELFQDAIFHGWLIANFGASFTFEICRKLNPNAHELAKTYAHHYGRPVTVLIVAILLSISGAGVYYAGFGILSIPPLAFVLISIIIWNFKPEKYKAVPALSALSSSVILWAPTIQWLIKIWRNP